MATNDKPGDNKSPFASLSAETLKHLDDIEGELNAAEEGLKGLKELGIDVSRLQEKIDWGKKAREVILKQFGNKKK